MGFLLTKPKLTTPKKSPKESRGDPQRNARRGFK